MIIVNINAAWGDPVKFTGATLDECCEQMALTIRECGEDFSRALDEHGDLIEGIDYEIVPE